MWGVRGSSLAAPTLEAEQAALRQARLVGDDRRKGRAHCLSPTQQRVGHRVGEAVAVQLEGHGDAEAVGDRADPVLRVAEEGRPAEHVGRLVRGKLLRCRGAGGVQACRRRAEVPC